MATIVNGPAGFGKALVERLRFRMRQFEPNDPRLKEGLTRIGIIMERQIKMNLRSQRLVDTGALLNSIGFELFKEGNDRGVLVGSFGIPYAAIHEFGGEIRPKNVQNLTIPFPAFKGRSAREFGDLFPVRVRGNTFLVRKVGDNLQFAFTLKKSVRIPARPYLRPAVASTRNQVLSVIQAMFNTRR